MIVTSLVLLIAAIVTLAVGWFQDGLGMVYVSIGASVAALAFLVAGVMRGRAVTPATAGESFGRAEGTEEAATAPAEPGERTKPRAPLAPRGPAARPPTGRPEETAPLAEREPEETRAEPSAQTPPAGKRAAEKTPAERTPGPGPSPRSRVVAIPERGTFHRSDCRFVRERDDVERITLGTAEKRGYSSCGVCRPDAPA